MKTILLAVLSSAALLACGSSSTPEQPPAKVLHAPELGPVPDVPDFADDPVTDAKTQLGTDMFFDARLSHSGHTSCNNCHLYLTGFQDNLIASVPDRSYPNDMPALDRNTLSFLNIVYAPVFRWDGSHTDLVDVMAFPFSEANMNLGMDVPSAQATLKTKLTTDVPGYKALFQTAFGQDITALDPKDVWRLAGRALRAFVRKAVSRNSAFDKWNAGDDGAMNDAAKRGVDLFRGKGRCVNCHSGPFFTDFSFHNLSTSPPDAMGKRADEGRFLITGKDEDRGKFLTPTLRSCYGSGPYFHDGSAAVLPAVLQHLSSDAVTKDPNHDPILATPLALTEAEIADLVELLAALRGEGVSNTITPPPPNTP